LFICFEIVFCIVMYKKKRKERENNNRKRDVCVFVFFLCMLLNQKNEFNIFNLYAQISKGQIKIMLYSLKNVEHVSTYILGTNN